MCPWAPHWLESLALRIISSYTAFRPNNAVALSNVAIVGGSLANFAFNLRRRHPANTRSLIDWCVCSAVPSEMVAKLRTRSWFSNNVGALVHECAWYRTSWQPYQGRLTFVMPKTSLPMTSTPHWSASQAACPHRDLILVMEPATIVGALLGSYLNKVTSQI